MKLALINPNNPINTANIPFLQKGFLSRARAISPPLNLCLIAAYTPGDIEVRIIDECVEPIDFDQGFDLVGITALTSTALRAYEMADQFRHRGVKVVMGGIHASSIPHEALEHCDSVVIGEVEGLWARILLDFQKGKLEPTYKSKELMNLEALPWPRRDLLKQEAYFTLGTVQTSRGCPFNCIFCSVTTFNGGTYRFRPVQDVVDEILSLPSRNVFFVDDNIITDRNRTRRLFEALIPLKIRWGSQTTLTIAEDEELLELAVESGCIGLAVGVESFSSKSLKEARKSFNKPEKISQQIKTLRKYGLIVWGSFIFGFDNDSQNSLLETVKMAERSRFHFVCFNYLTPLPGTEIYNRMLAEGRLLDCSWSEYNMSSIVFKPKNISQHQLEDLMKRAWSDFYALRTMVKRLGFRGTRFLWFVWTVNLALCYYIWKKLKANDAGLFSFLAHKLTLLVRQS